MLGACLGDFNGGIRQGEQRFTDTVDFVAKHEKVEGKWVLTPGSVELRNGILFNTYLDHRMAMAFAPLCALADVVIEDPTVTR